MDTEQFSSLLDAKLKPMQDNIADLKKGQERLVEVMTQLARQDESLKNLRDMIDSNFIEDKHTHNDLYRQVREASSATNKLIDSKVEGATNVYRKSIADIDVKVDAMSGRSINWLQEIVKALIIVGLGYILTKLA